MHSQFIATAAVYYSNKATETSSCKHRNHQVLEYGSTETIYTNHQVLEYGSTEYAGHGVLLERVQEGVHHALADEPVEGLDEVEPDVGGGEEEQHDPIHHVQPRHLGPVGLQVRVRSTQAGGRWRRHLLSLRQKRGIQATVRPESRGGRSGVDLAVGCIHMDLGASVPLLLLLDLGAVDGEVVAVDGVAVAHLRQIEGR